MVPRETYSRLSYLVATARVLAELAEGASDGVALLAAGQVGQRARDLQIDAAQFKRQARMGLSRRS